MSTYTENTLPGNLFYIISCLNTEKIQKNTYCLLCKKLTRNNDLSLHLKEQNSCCILVFLYLVDSTSNFLYK